MRSLAFVVTVAALGLAPATIGQEQPKIVRDQNEILRKSERLESLMRGLLERYEKEGRAEQVKLLREGLAYLKQSALLQDVAAVRQSLDSGALTEAIRKQNEIVGDLESLLDILLERRSVENLDQEIATTEELIKNAGELLERQSDLQAETRDARETQASKQEQELSSQLGELARAVRQESVENQRQAGMRRPTLEAALQNIERLLREQAELEQKSEKRLEGGQNDPVREQAFGLGEFEQGLREQFDRRNEQRDLSRLQQSALELQDALSAGRDGARQETERLRARLEAAARATEGQLRQQLEELAKRLAEAASAPGAEAARRQALEDMAREADKQASSRASELDIEIDAAEKALREQADQLAKAIAEREKATEGARKSGADKALERAEQAMAAAEKAAADPNDALTQASEALREAAEARRRFREANPDAGTRASEMAALADRTARGLRNSPAPEEAEQQAAKSLDTAEQALRDAAEELQRDDSGERTADPSKLRDDLGQSREQLEQARDTLTKALEQATAPRGDALQQAEARQNELRQQAEGLQQAMQRAAQDGGLTEQQNDAAQQGMERAQQRMEQASQSLQQGRQSRASEQQRQASDALEQARDSLQENRPLSEQEKQALQQLADEQKKLEDDIIRLAELVAERKNRRAEEALREAAQDSQRAQRALDQGDPDEAQDRQEDVKDQLKEAQDALEEERDRYMDLRQEELLFRIKDELQQFLDRQKPITLQTVEAGEHVAGGKRLTRPMRRKLNQLGEQEQELASRVQFIHDALEEEGTLVFTHVLRSNEADLQDIGKRLSGTQPDPGEYTVLLQRDVEERTVRLLEALAREQQRRRDEQQQQQQGQNQFGPQQRRLVPIISELKMLKRMEEEMMLRTREIEKLLEATGADGITVIEGAMAERLAHQHNALTEIFVQLKSQLEQAMQPPEDEAQTGETDKTEKKDKKEQGK